MLLQICACFCSIFRNSRISSSRGMYISFTRGLILIEIPWCKTNLNIGVALLSVMSILNILHTCSSVSIDNFEQVNADWEANIAQNAVISPNFLVWKFCGKTIRPKLCGNCVFPQNFHTRKSDEITAFYAVLLVNNLLNK